MRIVYLGDLWSLGTCLQRGEALARLGHSVDFIDLDGRLFNDRGSVLIRLAQRVNRWLAVRRGTDRLLQLEHPDSVDIVWFDKPTRLKRALLEELKKKFPSAKFVSYSPDDMFNPDNSTRSYVECIPLFDVHITTKSYNVREFYSEGARRVLFVDNAYCPITFRALKGLVGMAVPKYLVSFVGSYEKDRADIISQLWERGIQVSVFGPGWSRGEFRKHSDYIDDRWVPFSELVSIINATLINLCFLRKANRDLQTTRSVEIPACGGFMLAERTSEHERLFAEGEAAEYFSSVEEMADKIVYYINHPERAADIGRYARSYCESAGYSNDSRFGRLLERISQGERD